jgi:hypothetical protein
MGAGNEKLKSNDEQKPEEALRKAHDYFVAELWTKWKDNRDRAALEAALEPVKYGRLSVVSLTHVAAVIAVDVGMTEEQFCDVARANFKEAYTRAPKFG